jgi:hypothetical protein
MIKLEELATLLNEAQLDKDSYNKVIELAEKLEEEKAEEREANKAPKNKNKFTIVVRGDEKLKEILQDGWVVKTPLEQDDNELIERMQRAVGRSNDSQKKKKFLIKTFADFFLFCKRKFTKDDDVNILPLTKEPCRVIVLESSYTNPNYVE